MLESLEQRDRLLGMGPLAPIVPARPWWKRPPIPPSLHVMFGLTMTLSCGLMCVLAVRGMQFPSLARSSRRLMSAREGVITFGILAAVGGLIASMGVWQIVRAKRTRGWRS